MDLKVEMGVAAMEIFSFLVRLLDSLEYIFFLKESVKILLCTSYVGNVDQSSMFNSNMALVQLRAECDGRKGIVWANSMVNSPYACIPLRCFGFTYIFFFKKNPILYQSNLSTL